MVYELHQPGFELIDPICKGQYDKLEALFKERTAKWRLPYVHDECFTIDLFSDLENSISSESAFQLLPIALNLTLDQNETDLFATAFSLLVGLSRATKTTEIPPVMLRGLPDLRKKVYEMSDYGVLHYWESIHEWYRLTKPAVKG